MSAERRPAGAHGGVRAAGAAGAPSTARPGPMRRGGGRPTLTVVGRLIALEALGAARVGASLALDRHEPEIAAFLGKVDARQREAMALARRGRVSEFGAARAAMRAPAIRAAPLIDREAMILRLTGPRGALAPLRAPGDIADEGEHERRASRITELAGRWDGGRLRATLTLSPVILHAAGLAGLEARLLRLTPDRPRGAPVRSRVQERLEAGGEAAAGRHGRPS